MVEFCPGGDGTITVVFSPGEPEMTTVPFWVWFATTGEGALALSTGVLPFWPAIGVGAVMVTFCPGSGEGAIMVTF